LRSLPLLHWLIEYISRDITIASQSCKEATAARPRPLRQAEAGLPDSQHTGWPQPPERPAPALASRWRAAFSQLTSVTNINHWTLHQSPSERRLKAGCVAEKLAAKAELKATLSQPAGSQLLRLSPQRAASAAAAAASRQLGCQSRLPLITPVGYAAGATAGCIRRMRCIVAQPRWIEGIFSSATLAIESWQQLAISQPGRRLSPERRAERGYASWRPFIFAFQLSPVSAIAFQPLTLR